MYFHKNSNTTTMMKKILGLDLGTNSIGWAVIHANIEEGKEQLERIEAAGSRIIPMDAAILGDFDKGNSISQTSKRTEFRNARRRRERHVLRRERLHRILDLLGFLPEHYAKELDRYGKFVGEECKLPWKKQGDGTYEFIFKDSFHEMLSDFIHHGSVADDKKIPYDWTLYYLRKKALTQRISKEELAWILLHFNQKRGYYQRGEEEENPNKREEFYALKVVKVEDSGEKKEKGSQYNIHLEDGRIYRHTSAMPPDWEGKIKEFIITTEFEEGGKKESLRVPKEGEWALSKKRTENNIEKSGTTVGEYIYNTLLQNPAQKIRGKLIHTIERKYYKEELLKIINKQVSFHSELQDKELYQACLQELYPNNDIHRNNIGKRDFVHLFVNDIIFYQRPLKSKKSLIANCPYEENIYVDPQTGERKTSPIKCIAKSHPLFQEFRLWQFISNLRIYQKESVGSGIDQDVTRDLLPTETAYAELFAWLNDKKEIKQGAFLKYPAFQLKKESQNYRWNYVEDKTYPCNETRGQILVYLEKAHVDTAFLTKEKEDILWHILYSVGDKEELRSALQSFARRNNLNDEFVEIFVKFPPFPKDYASYSAKAIKRLLPLMRTGEYWNENDIDSNTRIRIDKIISGEYDENIRDRVREKAMRLNSINDFHLLPVWLACYIVYDRHSEAKDIDKWATPTAIDNYLKTFKQHSLHNPIVEQVIMETLRTVRDIWKQTGHIDEIHVELGREMKNPKDKRAEITRQILENENTNIRIKMLLTEFMNPEFDIENVHPYSPSQQDILRIYEEGVLNRFPELPKDIAPILKKFKQQDIKKYPTHSEIMRYKLWLEQKYISPYTGETIPLSKLFTPAYEIEHIIPKARYFDDSFNNKVICEAEINKLKSNCLGYEFIKKHHGECVPCSGKTVRVLPEETYEHFVREHYSRNKAKMKNLLLEDIPEKFINRQLNDTRYISKVVTSLLSNIVREKDEQETISKHLIVCTGGITDRLKKDWGLHDVWNKIILPRFERLNEIEKDSRFTSVSANGHVIPSIPLEFQRGFNKKRIDHRHHAMDAIVIACANRNIVNFLNNVSASDKEKTFRHDLQASLCSKCKTDDNGNYQWLINKPWETFTQDTWVTLQNIIPSFKQNLRVINKTTNHYQHYVDGKKIFSPQTTGTSWAIRKPMHKDTVFGEVNLRKIKTVDLKEAVSHPQAIVEKDFKKKLTALLKLGYNIKEIKKYFEDNHDTWQDINLSKINSYYFTKTTNDRYFATRKALDEKFTQKEIEKITDSGIQKILLRHLEANDNDPNLAFSPDGLEAMNQNIKQLNNGKEHQPIYKVRCYEKADKFPIGQSGNKNSKFVEAAKGTNLFFAIYESENTNSLCGKRTYATIPLYTVIDRQKKGLPSAPENENGECPKYVLSPNDLVYLPSKDEIDNNRIDFPVNPQRIYKMVSCTDDKCYFIPAFVAYPIVQTTELGSHNKDQTSWSNEMIKKICLPIEIDRLGNLIKIGDFKPE